MVAKIGALGFEYYIYDYYNCFDGIVVIISLVENMIGSESSGFSVLRGFRLLRIFKLMRSWTKMQELCLMVLESAHESVILGKLILLFIFINGLIAK